MKEKSTAYYFGTSAIGVLLITISAFLLILAIAREADDVKFVPRNENTTTSVVNMTSTTSTTAIVKDEPQLVPNDTEGCATRLPDGSWSEHGCLENPGD